MPRRDTLALVFDCDDTLIPDTSSLLLRSKSVDPDAHWRSVADLVKAGFEPSHAYLHSILSLIGEGEPLGPLTNDDLSRFGATLEGDLYPGLPTFFDDVLNLARQYRGIDVSFFVITGGLEDLVKGIPTIANRVDWVFGSRLGGDDHGTLRYVRRCVTFTEKTRYLFEINKFGADLDVTERNPYAVNKDVAQVDRKIPWQNMIYVGDGHTDIPCFSLLKAMGGRSFGVFDPEKEGSAKKALEEYLMTDRVMNLNAPEYAPNKALGSLLRAAVGLVCQRITVARGEAE